MEEDIKIVKEKIEIIENLCTDDCINKSTVIEPLKYALENLLKRYKELEEENKSSKETINILTNKLEKVVDENEELKKQLEEKDMQHELELIGKEEYTKASMGEIIEHYYTANEDCIPISVIQNKKSEIEKQLQEYEESDMEQDDDYFFDVNAFKVEIAVLEELLEERNK